jgi:maltose alpha-D-glucosyltransferase/alpha-amylase
MAIRCHGDFHLEQVLCAGDDFVFIDFEGEPQLPVGERQLKRSPLRDAAAMIRSFHYAADVASARQAAPSEATADRARALIEPWARAWGFWTSAIFLASYLDDAAGSGFVPADRKHVEVLLDAYLLERAISELERELSGDPARVGTPLRGILQLVGPQVRGPG